MVRDVMVRTLVVLAAATLVTGCADKKKQRITTLEEANRNLADELNQSRADLDAAMRDRDNCEQRLASAMRDASDLRARLASMPLQQPPPQPIQEAAPGWTAVPGGAMIAIEGSVLFAPGKAVLRTEAKRTLDRIVSAVQGEYGNKDVYVFGHTDDQPIKKSGWKDNWELSAERALAVVRYLDENGVSSGRLVASGCGEYRPRAGNSSEKDRATNRRVEFFAIDRDMLRSGT